MGVLLDDKISWKPQISHVRNKIAKSVGVLRRSRHLLNYKSLLMLYYALVYPYLNFGLEVWGNTYKTNLRPLIILQKRAIRIVHNTKYLDPTNPLFVKSSALKLPDLIKFKTLFSERAGCQRYELRGKQKLQEQGFRTTLKRMCISVHGVKLWNGLREEVRLCRSFNKFKGILKREVLENYSRGD